MPTTVFPIAVANDDWFASADAAFYPPFPGGSFSAINASFLTAQKSLGAGYTIGHAFMRWDTSSMGSTAVVSAASRDIYPQSRSDIDGLNLLGDWYVFSIPPVVGDM